MRDHLQLFLNGRPHHVRGSAVFSPVSTWLRTVQQLTGTKVVCAEGDCGSCVVFVGRPEQAPGESGGGGRGGMRYRVLASCIQYLYQLDGCHIVSIEGLNPEQGLNAVQQAMVSCQGTQCGYCTPGFVVSMYGLAECDQPLTEVSLRRGLTGNLCRCTGYEPIIRAGLAIDTAAVRRLDELYPPGPLVGALAAVAADPVTIRDGDRLFYKPTTLADATAFKREHPDTVVISGGTDLGVQLNKGMRVVKTMMSTAGLAELRTVEVADGLLNVGAAVSIWDLEKAAIEHMPEYGRLLDHFGSPPIKNAGTIGGNIANGSPIGDSMPALFVLDASVELAGPGGTRTVNINDFYTGYKRNRMAADEIISGVRIPIPPAGGTLKLYKISRRKDLDISTFTAAAWLRIESSIITEVRLAYGGVGPTVLRMPQTEGALLGQGVTEETFESAADVAAAEVRPISDVRGSAGFRQQLAGNVLRKLYFDMTDQCQSEREPLHRTNGHAATNGHGGSNNHAASNGHAAGNGMHRHNGNGYV